MGILHPDLGYPIWLFHPRVDAWSEHFEIDIGSAMIDGKTEKGMVTVAVLKMNQLRR